MQLSRCKKGPGVQIKALTEEQEPLMKRQKCLDVSSSVLRPEG